MVNKKAIGAGVLAATAAGVAAGYYFYASKNAKKHRKIAARWASDLKTDVIRQAKKVQHLDRKDVMAIVDTAARTYENVRDLNRKDIESAARELKDNWQEITKELKRGGSSALAKAKSSGKRAKAIVKRVRKGGK